ncbi:hypothetical protein GCM10009851_38090 [Herbiconiux moechotypicola]|uniref:Uncharacterized protein n=1 Tax=Herbiconiux moechotypicola TaxID=637393 RepID=A0ABN3E555_9MICO
MLEGDRRDPRVALAEIEWPEGDADAFAWGRRVLAERRVDARRETVAAVRALREAEPRLELKPATYLAERLAAGAGAGASA